MKRISIVFLKAVIVLSSIAVLTLLIWLPLVEGRATNLDLFSIYFDKFILYGYATSISFFVAMYNAFKLLGYSGEKKELSVKALKKIKYCAIILSVLTFAAGLYIKTYHNIEDDPIGFIAICLVIVAVSLVVATLASQRVKTLQNAIETKYKVEE